jgi:hypothetical protein
MARVVTSKPDNLLSIFYVIFGSILALVLLFALVSLFPLLAAIAICVLAAAAIVLAAYLLFKASVILWCYITKRR